jgi:hypothetical protein
MLALSSPTSGGLSAGIVLWQTQPTEFVLLVCGQRINFTVPFDRLRFSLLRNEHRMDNASPSLGWKIVTKSVTGTT